MINGNISSEKGGTGVGNGSASGANVLNFWKAKRERESAIWFLDPEMCFAVITNWSQAEIQIRNLNKGISTSEWERPLLMQCTVASLSQWIMMLVADHSLPHRRAATTKGYSSNNAEDISGCGRSDSWGGGRVDANQRP